MNEQQLFIKIAGGDEVAYTEVFHLFTPRLYPYILKITGDGQLAKELLQETFLRLWLKREDLQHVDNPQAWLFRIAANICLTHLRTSAVRNKLQAKVFEAMQPGNYGVEETVEAKDIELQIHKAVESLSPKQKEVYRLSREQGLSHHEIAERLGISINTVKTHIGIALKSLQEILSKNTGLSIATLVIILGHQ